MPNRDWWEESFAKFPSICLDFDRHARDDKLPEISQHIIDDVTWHYWWRHVNLQTIQNSQKTWSAFTSVLSDWRAAATCGELSEPSKSASADGEPRPVDSLRTPVTNHMMDGNTVNAPFGEQSAGRRDSARTVAAIRCAWNQENSGIRKTFL